MGEFPKDEMISFRTEGKYKRKARKLPCTYEDIFVAGLEKLSKEINILEYEKGELELENAQLEKIISANNARIKGINNRIRVINPSRLDKETLTIMINEASKDYAQEIYDSWGDESLKKLELDHFKRTVIHCGRDWGYDGSKFLELVEAYLNELCNTTV